MKEFVPKNRCPQDLLASLELSTDTSLASAQLKKGLDFNVIDEIAKMTSLKISTVMMVAGFDKRTFNSHLTKKTRWGSVSAARIYKAVLIIESAFELFDKNSGKAEQWLNKPSLALNGSSPANYTKKPLGQEAVLDLIGRLKNGIVI